MSEKRKLAVLKNNILTAQDREYFWQSPLVVLRFETADRCSIVFENDDMERVMYWLRYIALEGDVLIRTHLHPRHPGNSLVPEYGCHKTAAARTVESEKEWKEYMKLRFGREISIPEDPPVSSGAGEDLK